MDQFDAFAEVYTSIERHVMEHGVPPTEIVVAPSLYSWLRDILREEELLQGRAITDPVLLETPFGRVRLVIDETMSPYDVLTQ